MKFIISIITILITSILSSKASCDSIVVKVSKESIESGPWYIVNITSEIYTGGLLRKATIDPITSKSYFYTYTYDSIGRLAEEIRDSIYKKHYYYYVSGNDSASLWYSFNGYNYYLNTGTFYFYDTNNNLYQSFNEKYDTTQLKWDTTANTLSAYSIDSLIRTDRECIDTAICSFPLSTVITNWDSLGRVVIKTKFRYGFETDSITYDSICIFNKALEIHTSQHMQGIHDKSFNKLYYDSLCRPIKTYSSSVSGADFVPDRHIEYITDYFYADCSHIVIVGDDSLTFCPGQPDTAALFVFGGMGYYDYSWTPNDSLSGDTILNPIIYSNTSNTYFLSVNDTVGNNANFQLTLIKNCNFISENRVDLFKVFPNPARNFLFINKGVPEPVKKINVFNSIGQREKIEYSILNDESIEVKTSCLSPGFYFIEMQTEKRNFVRKFIRE
jgi:hypothetical protein